MNLEKKFFFIILASAFILRVLFSTYYVYSEHINTYEYGAIAQNIVEGKGYSLFYNDDGKVGFAFNADAKTYKSAWMPPLYVYFLVPFYLVESVSLRLLLVFIVQSSLSIIIIIFLFKLTEKYFDRKIALLTSAFYAFLPEFIFASATIGPTVLYHLLIIALIYLIVLLETNESIIQATIVGVITGVFVLLRSEIALFALIIITVLFIRKKLRTAFLVSLFAVITLFPWQIRNNVVFKEIIPFTTSGGFNFYRGHNQYQLGEWRNIQSQNIEKMMIQHDDYEIRVNDEYFQKALEFIEEQPVKVIINSIVKIFQLWIIDPKGKLTLHPLYLIPWLIVLLFALNGIIKNFHWRKYWVIYMFLISTTAIAIIFFVIPRYQTMFKITLLPFAAHTVYFYLNKLKPVFKQIAKH